MPSKFLGWEIEFEDITNNKKYNTEIVDIAIGHDINSSLVMCTIKFAVDTSFMKYFVKIHNGILTIMNKMIYTDDPDELFIIELQSVNNAGEMLEREEDMSQSNITTIPVRYMCKHGVKLLNCRVGGIYEKKNIESVIKDLYQKSECEIPLKLDSPNNTTQYDSIMIPESSFLDAIRYINQKYGIYDSLFMMYGNTFSNNKYEWLISNANTIKHEEVKLYFTQYEQSSKKSDNIDKKKYYIYKPIRISNTFEQIVRKIPKMINFASFDNDKLVKRKDIKISDVLGSLKFPTTNSQFDNLLEIGKQLFTGNRFDVSNFSVKDSIQKIGINAYNIPEIEIPSPFKLSHFRIGTILDLVTQNPGYSEADIKLMVVGWFLRIKQGNGVGGGGSYISQLKLRTAATSYLSDK